MSSSIADFIKYNSVFLSAACILIILNSVIAAKFLKLKTTKFDPKAYVAMTSVVTAVALLSCLILLNAGIGNNGKISIGVLLSCLLIAYVSHSGYVISKLEDNSGLMALCSVNLAFTFSILCYGLLLVYRGYNISSTSEIRNSALLNLSQLINKCKQSTCDGHNYDVTNNLKDISEQVLKGNFRHDETFSPQLGSLIDSIGNEPKEFLLKANTILNFIKRINDFMTTMTDKEKYIDIESYWYGPMKRDKLDESFPLENLREKILISLSKEDQDKVKEVIDYIDSLIKLA